MSESKIQTPQSMPDRRPLYFYDLAAEIIASLTYTGNPKLLDKPEGVPRSKASDHQPASKATSQAQEVGASGGQACALCRLSFTDFLEQRSHLKSDLHHYNLKQKLEGKQPVSEEEFEKLVEHLDESLSNSNSETDDDSSSDNEPSLATILKNKAKLQAGPVDTDTDDDDTGRRPKRRLPGNSPLLWLSSPSLPEHHYYGAYKAIFSHDELANESLVETIKKKQLAPIEFPRSGKEVKLTPLAYDTPHMFLCMTGGGHFAAMVVSLAPHKHSKGTTMDREATVLAHKTFHKYTTRRKQGGAQSANDNAKGKAKSIGAQIRRANEQALADDIRKLLVQWKLLIDTSQQIFVRATGAQNRRVIFGEGDDQVVEPKDPRVRTFPFSTGRATQKELMRAFIELTRLKIREIIPPAETVTSTPTTISRPPKAFAAAPERDEEAETALLHTTQLQSMIKRNKLPAVLAYVKNNKLDPDFKFTPLDAQANVHAPTPLHLASSQGAAVVVSGLLRKAGANPTVINKEGKTAFDLSGDRATRDAFRVARGELGEEKWDWDAGNVPPRISKKDADERIAREKEEEEERRKAEVKRLEEEQAAKGLGGSSKKQQRSAALATAKGPKWEEESKGLTPEMRMRLQREQRARAAEARFKRQ